MGIYVKGFSRSFVCDFKIPLFYLGRQCESRTQKYCYSHPCQNNGTCRENDTAYECNCVPGFSGRNCDVEINQCFSISCENNSTCGRVSAGQYRCHCTQGYTGSRCEFLQTVNFNNAAFIALQSAANRKNYSLKFSISTTVTSGLILYQGKVGKYFCVGKFLFHVSIILKDEEAMA